MSATTGPRRWAAARVARPCRDLARSGRFYGELLGLPRRGGFAGHDGYDGVFFGLPGGAELELTSGPVAPVPGTDDDLLVLYLPAPDRVREVAGSLAAAGVPTVPAANPYWDRCGRTFLDPDGYRVVLATREAVREAVDVAGLHVELHDGPRDGLRPLFELAEDSPAQLDSYLDEGRVLVAVTGSGEVLGHLQLVAAAEPGTSELKNMAVREDLQGHGLGGRLVAAAVDLLGTEGTAMLLVATAAADVGNLRFYQRHGFRVRAVERDAFTPATGYPDGLDVEGIELRDRVWLDRPISAGSAARAAGDPGTRAVPR